MYGWDNVARIIAKGRFTAKNATRRVLGIFKTPTRIINQFSKAMPDRLSFTLDEALEENPELIKMFNRVQDDIDSAFGEVPNVLEMVRKLEGRISHYGKHAGGVLIYPGLSKLLPMSSDSDERRKMVSEFDKYELEELGHFKYDCLGLETLPIIGTCLKNIKERHGVELDLDSLPLDDEKVYESICNGDLTGAFQIEGQKHMTLEQQPRNFADLCVLNAIIRPGVGDFGEYMLRRGGAKYDCPENAKRFMDETYNLMIFQEQYLQYAQVFAGWDLAYADANLRKNKLLGKNGPGIDEHNEKLFIDGGVSRGYDKAFMKQLWDDICIILRGGYGFNKSHAVLYAIICYWTVYLKVYYPECFYAALMSAKGDDQDKIALLINECKSKGIKIIPPDINSSTDEFKVTDAGISYRITTISHVGASAINDIVQKRPFTSFTDFLERRDTRKVGKRVIENLICAGCFDSLEPDRNKLMYSYHMTLRTKTEIKNEVEIEYEAVPHYEMENKSLGLYLTDNPLDKYAFFPLEEQKREEKLIGGKLMSMREIKDKNQNLMAFLTIQTKFETVDCVCFASTYPSVKDILIEGNLYLAQGRLSNGSILVNKMEVLD